MKTQKSCLRPQCLVDIPDYYVSNVLLMDNFVTVPCAADIILLKL